MRFLQETFLLVFKLYKKNNMILLESSRVTQLQPEASVFMGNYDLSLASHLQNEFEPEPLALFFKF